MCVNEPKSTARMAGLHNPMIGIPPGGLSNLQKEILLLAYRKGGTTFKHRGEQFFASNVDISIEEVVEKIFQSKSNTARASVSRAFKKLGERGFVERFYEYQDLSLIPVCSEIKLTPMGRERAKDLMIKAVLQKGP